VPVLAGLESAAQVLAALELAARVLAVLESAAQVLAVQVPLALEALPSAAREARPLQRVRRAWAPEVLQVWAGVALVVLARSHAQAARVCLFRWRLWTRVPSFNSISLRLWI
jgi:hypothetical protein